MNADELEALLAYIDARIDEKIEKAFGRDAGYEVVATMKAEDELRALLKAREA